VDERLRPASLVNRIVLPHEDAEDFESRRQLYAIRSDFSGRPAQRRNARGINAKGRREEVYFRTADFFGGAVFFRGVPF
jgi:hypothetical protein